MSAHELRALAEKLHQGKDDARSNGKPAFDKPHSAKVIGSLVSCHGMG